MMRSRSYLTHVTAALGVVGIALAGACRGDDEASPKLTEPGTTFEVDAGDTFAVVLDSNATTGYAWTPEVEPPADVVRLVDDRYIEPTSDLVGTGGIQELTFEAIGDGTATLELWYVRSFDDPPEPADRASFEVIVGTG